MAPVTASVPVNFDGEKAASVSPDLAKVTEFLTEISLPWRWVPGAKGFIEGVRVNAGGLDICPKTRASAVLHEAGHLACLPARFRAMAQDDLRLAVQTMFQTYGAEGHEPDSPAYKAALQCSDPEATAWAWAAGEHLGLAPGAIIEDDEYSGDGRFLRVQLSTRRHAGINGLAAAGFCVTRPGQLETVFGLPAYPRLARWLQQDFEPVMGAKLPFFPRRLEDPPASPGSKMKP